MQLLGSFAVSSLTHSYTQHVLKFLASETPLAL